MPNHGDHEFEPGVDVDMAAEGRSPDPRWCNVCGQSVIGVPALLDRLTAAETENAKLRAELKRADDWNWGEPR